MKNIFSHEDASVEHLPGIPGTDLETCLRVLQTISEDPVMIANEERLKALIAKIHTNGKRSVRCAKQQQRKAADRQMKAEMSLARDHRTEVFSGDIPWGVLEIPVRCYVCKQTYTRVHPWYHMLCPECAVLNAAKRTQRTDLTGRTALVTGGRIKIGFALALRLLRDGARVIVTTRFPADAARRFSEMPDQNEWSECLKVEGLDLRHIPSVERFTEKLLDQEQSLDILINNAAQTVKRPLAFYQHLLDAEQDVLGMQSLPWLLETWPNYPKTLSMLPENGTAEPEPHFPLGVYDTDGQQIDRRPVQSWRLRLEEVGTLEMLEVHLVNTAAPFLLNSRLKPLLMRSLYPRRFIINVSAMEGQFNRESKTIFHPHTNMAKAALNMMTRTSAPDYARAGIYMNSVDTGWVTDENPFPQKMQAQKERGFWTPLAVEDAVARIYDPIVQGLTDEAEPLHGHFLKDYKPYAW